MEGLIHSAGAGTRRPPDPDLDLGEHLLELALGLGLIVLAVGAAVAYAVTRSTGQPAVSADVLPVVANAHVADVYVDCSKLNGVAYFSDNPCQTFVLLESKQFSGSFFLEQRRRMSARGWSHTAPQPVDFDAIGATASRGDSWGSPGRRACAYLNTVRAGARAEARGLFPYDPNNQPAGVLDFYRKALAANPPTRSGYGYVSRTETGTASPETAAHQTRPGTGPLPL